MPRSPFLVAAVLGTVIASPSYSAPVRRPNIVLVLFDDLGFGQPPSYRSESTFRTPHLDRLCHEGVRFTDAHSASAVCTPTRYGLLTGRYPSRIQQYGVLTTYSKPLIPKSRATVASLLKQVGYDTACVGKWHLGLHWDDSKLKGKQRPPIGATYRGGPEALGFDYFCGFTHARNIESVLEQGQVVARVKAAENQPLMLKKAVAWLQQRDSERPFFLYFPMCPPHTPVAPTPEFLGRSGAEDKVGKDPKYGDWILQGDSMLGELLQTVDQLGASNHTLVLVASDNGAERRAYPPYRASKRSIYEGGHRVPLAAKWPGVIPAGGVCQRVVCLNDLFATCCEAAGAAIPADAGEDSFSLLPQLRDPAASTARDETIHQSHRGDLAIRQGPWKLVFLRNGRRELYRLDRDPGEAADLWRAAHPQAARLQDRMREILETGRSRPGAGAGAPLDFRFPGQDKWDASACESRDALPDRQTR